MVERSRVYPKKLLFEKLNYDKPEDLGVPSVQTIPHVPLKFFTREVLLEFYWNSPRRWDGSLLKMAPIELEGIRCFFRFSLGNPGPIPGHIDNHGADRVEQRRTSSSRPAGASVSAVPAGACTKYGDLDNGWWHWGGQFLDVSSNSLGNQ